MIKYPSDDPIEYIDKFAGSNALTISINQSLFEYIEKKTDKLFLVLNENGLGNIIENKITKNEIGSIFFELLWDDMLKSKSQPDIKKLIFDILLKNNKRFFGELITKYKHESF